ncbi:MAG: hypothetical protein J6A15_09125 [Clostridia bacterium]|nr:hypothetical protein [Clostridia bacterium]
MKMIIAINNPVIEQKLIEKYKNIYEIIVLSSKEDVLDVVNLNEESLIITREDLGGKVDFLDYIITIKERNLKNKVVIIVKKLTKELKEKLFAKEIFNIIEGNSFLFEELIENIEVPKLVIYKSKDKISKKSKVIIITGTRCSGKTVLTKMLAESIAKNKDKKVLAIDLDFIYPSLDTYLQFSKNYSLVDFLKDLISSNIKKMENYESANLKYKNLKYILNNKSIGIPNDEILVAMINILKKHYDYIIVDTSTLMINKIYSISKLINCQIIYLLEESIKSLREYKLDVSYIDKKALEKTKFVLTNSKNNKEIIKEIEKILPSKVIVKIKKYYFIELIIRKNYKVINLNRLLKAIGVIKFEKLKLKIIEKILNLEEE